MKQRSPRSARFLRNIVAPMLSLGLFLSVAVTTTATTAPQTSASETALNAGIAEFKKGKFKEAKKKFQEALQADPESKRAYQALGSALTTLGEYDAAIKLFGQYFAKWPQDDFAYRGLATVQIALAKFAQAYESARKAKALDAANSETDYLTACALLGLNRPFEARDAADSALRLKPDYENGLRVRLQAGYRLFALKNDLIVRSTTPANNEKINRLKTEKAELLKENVETIRAFLRQPNAPNRPFWEEQIARISEFEAAIADFVKPGDADGLNYQRPKVITMPKPQYTEQARQNRISGRVGLLVLIDENGTPGKMLVADGLPDGLTESALKTVTGGKFSPATRDGKPVKAVAFIEVTYNIY